MPAKELANTIKNMYMEDALQGALRIENVISWNIQGGNQYTKVKIRFNNNSEAVDQDITGQWLPLG